MFRLVGRLAVAFIFVAEFAYADPVIRDSRDGKNYKAIASGKLNWFTDNLAFQKTVAFRDNDKNAYYKQSGWMASCPAGTHLPDIQEWTLFAKDRFTGPRKLSNVKSFAGKTRGFYDLADPARNIQGKDAAEVAERRRGNRCAGNSTSCADQLSKAIDLALANESRTA